MKRNAKLQFVILKKKHNFLNYLNQTEELLTNNNN